MDRSENQIKNNNARIIYWVLFLILLLKVGGFFTMSENVALTRVIKVGTRIFMTAAIILTLIRLKKNTTPKNYVVSNSMSPLFYGLYLFFGLVSIFWSTSPSYSLLQWVMDVESLVFCYFFMCTLFLAENIYGTKSLSLSQILGGVISLILLFFLIGLLIDPDKFFRMTHGGEVARLGGLLMNPNELGMLAVIGCAMTCIGLLEGRSKLKEGFGFLICLTALILTGSRSSMVGFFLILGIFVWKFGPIHIKLGASTIGFLSLPLVINMIFIKQGDIGEVLSMTGRIPFWKALLTEGLPESPLLGFGFMRIAWEDTFQSVNTYAGHMTHNTFIQVLMNLGFVGFLIVLIQLTFTFYAYLSSSNPQRKKLFIGIMIPIIINSFTEFGIFGETNYGILFYQLVIFLFFFKPSNKAHFIIDSNKKNIVS